MLPLCVENLLDRRHYNFTELGLRSINSDTTRHEMPQLGDLGTVQRSNSYCRLLNYTTKQMVACIDNLNQENVLLPVVRQANLPKNYTKNVKDNIQMQHVVFLGDSRIRQQFFNFLRVSRNRFLNDKIYVYCIKTFKARLMY